MDPDQLWETTMEPATRTLLQVSIDAAAEAERVVSDLMETRCSRARSSSRSTRATSDSWTSSVLVV